MDTGIGITETEEEEMDSDTFLSYLQVRTLRLRRNENSQEEFSWSCVIQAWPIQTQQNEQTVWGWTEIGALGHEAQGCKRWASSQSLTCSCFSSFCWQKQ